ncbi:hypothetical protein D3C71_2117940 [compost metagenome]
MKIAILANPPCDAPGSENQEMPAMKSQAASISAPIILSMGPRWFMPTPTGVSLPRPARNRRWHM